MGTWARYAGHEPDRNAPERRLASLWPTLLFSVHSAHASNERFPADFTENGVTWSAFGTVVEVERKAEGLRMEPSSAYAAKGDEERIWDSERIDADGYRWVVSAVDMGAVQSATRAYDDLWAAEESFNQEAVDEVQDLPALYRPLGWSETDCDADSLDDNFVYDTDDRAPHPDPMQARQRGVVLLLMNNQANGAGVCSGTIVDGNTILTAAHCFWEDDNTVVWGASATVVCTRGNTPNESSGCYNATSIIKNGAYDGAVANDFAVVKLAGSVDLGSTEQVIEMSTAADSVLDASSPFAIGYPGFKPDCSQNGNSGSPYDWYTGFHGAGSVIGTPTGYVKTDLDMGGGQSGGAIWFFASGQSEPKIMAVISRNHPYYPKWNGGPKVRDIRTWVITQF